MALLLRQAVLDVLKWYDASSKERNESKYMTTVATPTKHQAHHAHGPLTNHCECLHLFERIETFLYLIIMTFQFQARKHLPLH